MIRLFNADSLSAMKAMPDKAYDLAIVDPPYGDGRGGREARAAQPQVNHAYGGRFARYWRERESKNQVERTGGTWASKYGKGINRWDVAPPPEYFTELFRISRFQIVWGGNYFSLPGSRNFVVWKKLTISERFTMAMAEYAWTNIQGNAKVFEYPPQGNDRFHPTQKPVALYKWLLTHYAKPGDKILDTHGGSGSICIACHDLGFDLDWYEIDVDYFTAAKERLERHQRQAVLFVGEQTPPEQPTIFAEST